MRPDGPPAAGGFTLLELLVALVITAVALAVFAGGSLSALEGGRAAGDRLESIRWAQSLLAELALTSDGTAGETGGRHPAGFDWRARIMPLAVGAGLAAGGAGGAGGAGSAIREPSLVQIEVSLTRPGTRGPLTVTLATTRLVVSDRAGR